MPQPCRALRSQWLVGVLALASLGCSQSSTPHLPALQDSAVVPAPSAAVLQSSDLGRYQLTLNPDLTEATVAFLPPRSSQANDDLYWLPIGNFLRANSLRVTGLSRAGQELLVEYVVTHPFPAPQDPAGTPNGSTNRSDLGIAGQVVLLADVVSATGNTFFTDTVANTSLVTNAAGYTRPAGLINPGTTANAFPYQVLVDEAGSTGNRVGISNGGVPTGNFGTDGWTRAEYGAGNAGWTGYGVLHQGQAAAGQFAFDVNILAGNGGLVSLNLAILAKYNDPRGGLNASQKRGNRLPPATPDHTRFAYRMPHGALDIERITWLGESGGFLSGVISASTLSLELTDWDARAVASPEADLANDSDVTRVYATEVGAPAVEISIPEVLGATVATLAVVDADPAGDPDPDSGHSDDPIYYSGLVTAPSPTGTPGTYTGLVRATDPEQGQVRDWQFFLDGNLTPVGNPPEAVTYQAFTVDVAPSGNLPPSATVTVSTPQVANGNAVTIQVNNIQDPDDVQVMLRFDWDDDGTVDHTTAPITVPAGPLNYNSFAQGSITFTHTPPAPDYRTLAVEIFDGTNTVDITPAVGSNGEHFEVLPPGSCPNPPTTGTNVTSPFVDNITLAAGSFGHPYASSAGNHDAAAMFVAPYLGWIMYQHCGAAATRDFFRYPDTGAAGAAVRVTNTNLGGFLNGQIAHQIEVDSTNRVLMALKVSNGTVSYPANNYPVSGGATTNIYWFDYSGTEVTALGGTINTGTERAMALTMDSDDNVYMLSHTHQLHRYDKVSGYAEAAGYPINLVPIIGDPTITTPAADAWRVVDFVINWHNESFYILTVNNTAATNARLHRLYCDATEAGSSPVTFTVVDIASGAHNRSSDLTIDQFDATGGAIPEADVQIIVGGAATATGAPDLRFFNADLVMTHSWDVGNAITTAYRIAPAVSTNNVLVTRQSNSSFGWIFYTPPAGWQ